LLTWRQNIALTTKKPSQIVAVIDAAVAEVFTTAEAVNKALRALISAMPTK